MSRKSGWLLVGLSSLALSHPLVLNSTDSALVPRNDGLLILPRLPAPPIAESSKNPEPSSLECGDYEACGKRGAKLYADLLDDTAIPSSFQALESLEAWGWESTVSRQDTQFAPIMGQLREPLQRMHISSDDMQVVRAIHEQETKHGETYPATHGQYDNVYFPSSGAILAWESFSPAHRQKGEGPLPALQRWSDVAWLNWLRANTANGQLDRDNVRNLRYIIRAPVINKKTRDVVKDALKKAGVKSGIPGPFPGQMLRPSKSKSGKRKVDPFEAVLGTENISGSAYLLTQHRNVLGRKIITGIQVWVQPGVKGAKNTPTYVIVAHIEDFPSRKRALEDGGRRNDKLGEHAKVAAREELDARSDSLHKDAKVEYGEYVSKGRQLYHATPELSKFNQYSDLAKWGWDSSKHGETHDDETITGFLEPCVHAANALGLTIGDGKTDKNTLVYLEHSKATKHGSVTYPATGAQYHEVYNPSQGVIYSWNAYSPAYESARAQRKTGKAIQPLPELSKASDVTYLEWAKRAKTPEQRKGLRYAFGALVSNKKTREIINEAVETLVDWPGVELKPSQDAFFAVLKTENVQGVAWMLSQHRGEAQLGDKVIESIVVWKRQEDDWPNILVKIADAPTKHAGEGHSGSHVRDIDEGYWSDHEVWLQPGVKDARDAPSYVVAAHAGHGNSMRREELEMRSPSERPVLAGPSKATTATNVNQRFSYQSCAERGARLYQIMIGKVSAPRTDFTDYEDLKAWGWRIETKTSDPELRPLLSQIQEPLRALGVSGSGAQVRKATHARAAKHNGRQYQPTGGHYFDVYYPNDGTILAWDNESPEHMSLQPEAQWGGKPLPDLQRFSDVVFLNWKDVAGSEHLNTLQYVIRYPINNANTQEVIRQALVSDGVKSGEPGAWPGHTLKYKAKGFVGKKSTAFEAVLGTENVNGIVYLLSQHQAFEGRIITGIQVWRQAGGKSGGLGIVVHIGRGTAKRADDDEEHTSTGLITQVRSLSDQPGFDIDEGYWSDDGGGDPNGLQRRAPPAGSSGPSKDYIASVRKGHELYLRMIQDKSVRKDNQLSKFSLYSDLATHGWTVSSSTFNPEQIGAVEKASDAKGLRWQDRSRNQVVVATHPGTNAQYVNIFNPTQGAIYAFDKRSPNYEKSKPGSSVSKDTKLPKLQHYSDVTYLTWAKSTTRETRTDLKYFFSVQVLNPTSKAIINEALRWSGQRLDVWPGHKFTAANMNPFLAVMATDNVQGVAFMLAQHRGEQQLGDKVISSITVWRPLEGAESSDPTPAIMVEIQDRPRASRSGT